LEAVVSVFRPEILRKMCFLLSSPLKPDIIVLSTTGNCYNGIIALWRLQETRPQSVSIRFSNTFLKEIVNIAFNKIVGSLKNIVRSKNLETRLKKWRSGIEAVISTLKRGYELFRCKWKIRAKFNAKVYWNVIVYNIRVMTGALLAKMQTQIQ
jgi:hypothetical protein